MVKKLLIGLAITLVIGGVGCSDTTAMSPKKTQLNYMVEQVKSIDQKKDISGEYRKEVLKNLKDMDTSKSDEYVKNINKEMVRLLDRQVNQTGDMAENLIDLDKVVHEVETVTKDMK